MNAIAALLLGISIHALARSATAISKHLSNIFNISIHALARSATYLSQEQIRQLENFNPRTREECDETFCEI